MSSRPEVRELREAEFRQHRDVISTIQDGLTRFNQQASPDPGARHLVLYLEDDGIVLGGLIGRISRCWLRIDTLWIQDEFRGLGLGRDLLERAESIGMAEGCHSARLDSYSFQAHDFYRRSGYEEFARLDGLPNSDVHYFFRKSLLEASSASG